MDEEVDHGPILAQAIVEIKKTDTMETLESRIHETEHKIYPETLKDFFDKHPVNTDKWEDKDNGN